MQFFVLLDFGSAVVFFFVCVFKFIFSSFGVLAGVLRTLTAKHKINLSLHITIGKLQGCSDNQ